MPVKRCPFRQPACLCEKGPPPVEIVKLKAPPDAACTFCHAPVGRSAVVITTRDDVAPHHLGPTRAAYAVFCGACAEGVADAREEAPL